MDEKLQVRCDRMRGKMRNWKLALLTAAVACSMCACKDDKTIKTNENSTNQQTEQGTQSENTTNENAQEETNNTTVENTFDESTLTEKQKNMKAAMQALVFCNTESNLEYAPKDPTYFWTALQHVALSCGDLRPDCVTQDETTGDMSVYDRTCQEFATAIFYDYSDLLELPKNFDRVTKDEANEAFIFTYGEMGVLTTEIASWTENADGTQTVEVQLVDPTDEPKSVEAIYQFTLIDNPFADAISEPLFYYSVKDMVKIS